MKIKTLSMMVKWAQNVDFFSIACFLYTFLVSPPSSRLLLKYISINAESKTGSIRIVLEVWNYTIFIGMVFNQYILCLIRGWSLSEGQKCWIWFVWDRFSFLETGTIFHTGYF